MAKRGPRAARFATLRGFFQSFKSGLMTSEAVTANIEATGYIIFESELEKFGTEFPEIPMEEFTEWLKEHKGFKVAGARISSGGGTGGKTLNTPEKALSVGVAPENVQAYIDLINIGYEWKTKLQKIVTKGTVTITVPIRQPKQEKKAEATTAEMQAEA